jgi:hypothetical protein
VSSRQVVPDVSVPLCLLKRAREKTSPTKRDVLTSVVVMNIDHCPNRKIVNISVCPLSEAVTCMKNTIFDPVISYNRQKTYFVLEKNLRGTRFIT